LSQRIKDLLAAAAGTTGAGDQSWHAGRVDRLYFSDPRDINAAGQVDVIGGPEPTPYVRVELWIRPELAAQIVGLVTGEVGAIETRLRHELRAELLPALREQVERERVTTAAEDTATQEELPHTPPPDDPRGFSARDTAAKADLARRDGERMAELTMLVKQQADDEAAEAKTAADGADGADGVDTDEGEEAAGDVGTEDDNEAT
jgi:hypothetical protein